MKLGMIIYYRKNILREGDYMLTKDDKILIYPFSYKAFSIVKLLVENKFNIIVATEDGTGLIGKDIAFSVNRKKSDVSVLKYSDELLEEVDLLFIPEGYIGDPINEGTKDVLQKAIKTNKRIISSLKLDEENKHLLEYSKYIDLLTTKNLKIDSYLTRIKENRLSFFIPNIPVIYVGGVFDIVDNNYITISLKQKFKENGYRACCIMADNSGKLFDCLTFPKNFINNGLSIEDRIMELNNYIRACVELIKPHVIIIQIPFGMIRYNKYFENSFGSYAFMISQAIKSDYFICASTPELIDSRYFKELSSIFDRQFNSAIDALHISNCELDIPMINRASKVEVIFSNESKINDIIGNLNKDLNFKVFNVFMEKDLENLFQDIIEQLG
ncbi:hypothetical protein KQI41_05315 [Tissierella pigra]|uniref:TIGR04066 family peptide maturation system protein n=1 Tax=Tissierella pigra TaxID=2607614 RepID=A0A6N7XYM7_9FIRM|nr:hypothetical protein [Tissierella pigra]MBU5425827.1 hypothetical protein [Tissierella pigra]MSU01595.1 hypothetical protein [Tissierella pigra]